MQIQCCCLHPNQGINNGLVVSQWSLSNACKHISVFVDTCSHTHTHTVAAMHAVLVVGIKGSPPPTHTSPGRALAQTQASQGDHVYM